MGNASNTRTSNFFLSMCYSKDISLRKSLLGYIRNIRKEVKAYRQGKHNANKKDYPRVAAACKMHNNIGKGYSRSCAKRLQRKRPQLHRIVIKRLSSLGLGEPIKVVKEKDKKPIFIGTCAEDMAATELLIKEGVNIKFPTIENFTQPLRVRTGQKINMCNVCKNVFK